MGKNGTVQHVRMGRVVVIKMDDTNLRWGFNRSCLEHKDDKPPTEWKDEDDEGSDDDSDDEMHTLEGKKLT